MVHFWFWPPAQVPSRTAVPLAVEPAATSRQSPDCVPVTVPSALTFHCWLAPPWQAQMIAAVPGLVPPPSASRQRSVSPE